jgi:hypothetical protein
VDFSAAHLIEEAAQVHCQKERSVLVKASGGNVSPRSEMIEVRGWPPSLVDPMTEHNPRLPRRGILDIYLDAVIERKPMVVISHDS